MSAASGAGGASADGNGGGAAVVLLPGIGSDARAFGHQVTVLADAGFRPLAWNAPGYGGTPRPAKERPLVADYVDSLTGFLDAQGVMRCHLVGSSFGAVIATAMAAAAPDRVRTLVLTAPVLGAGGDAAARDAELRHREQMMRDGVVAYYEQRRGALFASRDPQVERVVRAMTLDLDPRAYLQAAHALANADLVATAAGVSAPSLVLCGELDTIAPPQIAGRAASAALRADLRVFDGCAHLLELEAPDRFACVVADFASASG